MCIFEYNEELHIKNERKIAMEAVIEKGFAQGQEPEREQGQQKTLTELICKKMKKNKSVEVTAGELETDMDNIRNIWQIASRFAPDFDADQVFAAVLEKNVPRQELFDQKKKKLH